MSVSSLVERPKGLFLANELQVAVVLVTPSPEHLIANVRLCRVLFFPLWHSKEEL